MALIDILNRERELEIQIDKLNRQINDCSKLLETLTLTPKTEKELEEEIKTCKHEKEQKEASLRYVRKSIRSAMFDYLQGEYYP